MQVKINEDKALTLSSTKMNCWLPSSDQDIHLVAKRSGVPATVVRKVMQHRPYAIRYQDPEMMYHAMKMVIARLVRAYGCYERIDIYVLEAAAGIVTDYFSHLAIPDIELAYELWGGGQLDDRSIVPMYNGFFTVPHLRSVLEAYQQYRSSAIKAAADIEQERNLEDYQERKNERIVELLKVEVPAQIEEARLAYQATGKFDWRNMPLTWYSISRRERLLAEEDMYPGEKKAIWEESKEIARRVISSRRDIGQGMMTIQKAMKDMERLDSVGDKPAILIHTFQRLVIYRKLIQQVCTLPLPEPEPEEEQAETENQTPTDG